MQGMKVGYAPEKDRMQEENEFTRVDSLDGVSRCLEGLMQQRGAFLLMDEEGAVPLPVVLESADPGQGLRVDISSIREVATHLKEGAAFRLLGQRGGKLERSELLKVRECHEEEDGYFCQVDYPGSFEVLVRRNNFRAELRRGMECEVVVDGGEAQGKWDGRLSNLSMTGCLVELPLGAATMLAAQEQLYALTLSFPNGTHFTIRAELCHEKSDLERRLIHGGFEFEDPDSQQDRELWYFVREIERENARHAAADGGRLEPSSLFVGSEKKRRIQPRRKGEEFPSPMARDLSFIAEFLDTQVLALRSGNSIDGSQLSKQSERLLSLLDTGRDELLFALSCLWHEAPIIRHCLGVAVRLVDIAGRNMPQELRKVMMASAMVHDLGKVLLPPALVQRESLEPEDEVELHQHVEALRPRLAGCGWLSPEISEPVIFQINERFDGSGYPQGLKADALHHLARLAAVVDVADAMGRKRPDREAMSFETIYRYLQSVPKRLDPRWVSSYREHFGEMPIGTLLRYEGGDLGWVLALDEKLQPFRVQLTMSEGPPRASILGDRLEGSELQQLGRIEAVLPAE